MTSNLTARVLPYLPGSVQGAGGITVTQIGSVWTVAPTGIITPAGVNTIGDITINASDTTQLNINNPSGQYSACNFNNNNAVKVQLYWDNTLGQFIENIPTGAFCKWLINNVAALTLFPSGGLGVGAAAGDPGAGGIKSTASIVGVGIQSTGFMALPAPITTTGASGSVAFATPSVIFNNAGGAYTVTLPAASSFGGVTFHFKATGTTTAVNSASSNIVPLAGGAAAAPILSAAGKWAWLQSDGTNYVVMAGN